LEEVKNLGVICRRNPGNLSVTNKSTGSNSGGVVEYRELIEQTIDNYVVTNFAYSSVCLIKLED
jgi:hypothetical protein